MNTAFFHIACIGNAWCKIVEEIMSAFQTSNVYSFLDSIHVGVSGTTDDLNELKKKYSGWVKLKWHYHGEVHHQYEFPTLKLLRSYCKANPGSKVLYCHTKGVSKPYDNPFWKYWRRYLIHSCIEGFQRHHKALDSHDVSGNMWSDNTHFSGNFWWANAAHINLLPDLDDLYKAPKTIWEGHSFEENRRLQCEMWIGMRKGLKVMENGILNAKPGFASRIFGTVDERPCLLNDMEFDKIYLINLDQRPDRYEDSLLQLNSIGLKNVIRFPAINAKAMGITKRDLDNPGLIGCFLSHYFILQEAVMNNYKRLLIFEDDVTFIKGFNEAFAYAKKQLPDDWEMVYLGYTERFGEHTYKEKISDSIAIPNDPWGTQAYMVQNEGIRILYENLKTIKDHIDIQISRHIASKLKIYEIFPSLCPQSGAESDINVSTVKFKLPKRRGNFAQLN